MKWRMFSTNAFQECSGSKVWGEITEPQESFIFFLPFSSGSESGGGWMRTSGLPASFKWANKSTNIFNREGSLHGMAWRQRRKQNIAGSGRIQEGEKHGGVSREASGTLWHSVLSFSGKFKEKTYWLNIKNKAHFNYTANCFQRFHGWQSSSEVENVAVTAL